METTKTKKKETKKTEVTKSKKLSPLGEWIRKHPHGLEGVIIYDRSILCS